MMKELWIEKLMPLSGVLLGSVILLLWWFGHWGQPSKERLPGLDGPAESATEASSTKWEGRLIRADGVPADLPGAWPRFRGANLDGISPETAPLARAWGESGPPALWTIDVGEGFAGATVWNGRVFLVDYDRQAQADAIRCLSLADGREIWRYAYPVKIKRNHGMSRTVPAVTDKYVVSIGPKCHVTCLDPVSGELRWVINLARKFNTEVPPWYAGQCPLIEGDRAIIAPGGDALVIAVDCVSGKVLWQTPNPLQWQMTHSSPIPMELSGQRMYLYCGSGGIAGVSATDGALLWSYPDWKISIANVPSPVPIGDGRIFLSGGYEAGSMMLQVQEREKGFQTKSLYRLKPTVYGATQHTPILYQNHLYGIRPDGQFVCLDLDGKILWKSGPEHRFGNGPFLIAQGLIYAMNDNGLLSLAEATPAGYKQLAQAKVLPGPEAWGPMALAGGRLILRDLYKMVCLDVAQK